MKIFATILVLFSMSLPTAAPPTTHRVPDVQAAYLIGETVGLWQAAPDALRPAVCGAVRAAEDVRKDRHLAIGNDNFQEAKKGCNIQ